MNDTVRTFIAVNLPAAVKAEIVTSQSSLREKIGSTARVRWTPPDQFHLTIRFLGSIPESLVETLVDRVRATAAGMPRFSLNVAGAGCFPSFANPRIVWAGIGGEAPSLVRLQAAVQEATAEMGEPPEKRAYRPYLTLGRVKADNLRDLRHIGMTVREFELPPAREWRVESIEVMRSQLSGTGASYSVLAHVPLGA